VITRVWTATDDNSNSKTYTQTITVVDTTAPTFTTSPASVTVECDAATTTNELGTAAASDNCDNEVTITSVDSTVAGTGNNSVITRVWTATDDNSNSATYTQTITVADTTAPVADELILSDITAECSVETLTVPSATDNCAGLKRGVTSTVFPITSQGTTVVTWTFTDDNGNISAQTQNVVINDTTAPSFTTSPASVTVQCDAATTTNELGTAAASDNCDDDVTVTYADTTASGTGNNSVITRVWTATDDNSNAATYTQTITVVDTTAPTFTTSPANVTVECSASTDPSDLGTAAASDNCDSSVTMSYTDSVDTVNEIILCSYSDLPNNIKNGLVGYWPFCGNTDDETENENNGINNNSQLTEDRFGNENNAYLFSDLDQSMITINPSESLFISGNITLSAWFYPTDTTVGYIVDRDECGFNNDWGLQWKDGQVKLRTQNNENDIVSGILEINNWYHVIVTRSIESGLFTMYINSQITSQVSGFNYSFTNTNLPIRIGDQSCTSPEPNFDGKIDDIAIWDRILTNEEIVSVYNNFPNENNNSEITRTWTATDDNGNSSTYTQTITVVDTTAPVADVANLADVTAECSVDTLTAPTATDNCSGTITGTTTTALPITAQGTTVVTWTFVDNEGNTTTQTQNVIIDDVTAPVADVANLADVTAECSVDTLTAPTATDNCSGTITGTTTTALPITAQGTTVVTWTFVDNEGNISTQTQNVIIDDVTAPVADVANLADVTAECSVDTLTAPTATDNCSGTITGTTTTALPITAQGTTVVTWTFVDNEGNTTTQTQNVIIDDVTAPVADVANLADVTAECSVDTLTAPTATDNCSGTITGTTTTALPITAQGTTVVTWTFVDNEGNTTTQTQNVIIDDVTAPVADVANLADVTAECSVDTLTAPTATDNCSGTITGTTTTALPITAQGTTVVTWTFVDNEGNTTTQTQNVIIDDVTAPVADVANLADVTAECSVDTLTAPTATDNCSGTITGTTTTALPITAQGTTVVTWTFVDNEGNTTTQTQNVIIDDVTAPVADVANLADVTAECSVDTLTAPTATDNCSGTITGTTTTALPITAQGTTVVTWTFVDNEGNTTTQTQNVIIDDVTAPVADVANLADVTAECSVDTLTAPTATDNCSGTITGTTTTALPITAQGTTVVTWTFVDNEGNTTTQTQNVIIDDVTAPVADVANLADVTAECSVDTLTAPTATDNCSGTITGTTTTALPITAQGTTVVTWTFVDNEGNISTQTQNVIIDDVTAPVADVANLADVTAECSVDTLTAPTATDNCSGTITGTTTTALPITAQGTTVVTWTFVDNEGNTTTQTQNVIIDDVTAPVADVANLADVTAECSVDTLTAPTATDNCSGTITGTTTTALPITAQGTTVVTWTFVDNEGNITTQTQNVIIDDVTAPVADVANLADVTAECSVDTLTAPTATDNCSGTITGTTTTALPITAQGTTVVTWTFVG
jgi:hypothetical protein